MVYISPGNRRMNIPTFSLPTGHTCPGATPTCMNWCYAKKAERAYKNVIPSRARNLNDSKRDDFIQKMIYTLDRTKSPYIRIHESGDFYSQQYLDKWLDICRVFPEKQFLVYTQSYHLDFSLKPDNLIVYWTVWPDTRNYPTDGLRAFVVATKGKPIGNYRDASYVPVNGFKCKKEDGSVTCEKCLHCYKGKGDVIFDVH
jgi:hypothetical protein